MSGASIQEAIFLFPVFQYINPRARVAPGEVISVFMQSPSFIRSLWARSYNNNNYKCIIVCGYVGNI